MGSIVHYSKNYKWWKLLRNDLSLKSTGETIYSLRIGTVDDYYTYDYDIYMRKDTYDKLQSGEYIIYKHAHWLTILDRDGNIVPMVGDCVY